MKNTKAKLLGLLLVIAVVFSVFAIGAFAGESVHVGDSDALEAAVSNGTADYIVLDGDITTDDVLAFNANDTIDLNGYKLTLGKGNNVVAANKSVTIINGTVCIDGVNANTDGSVESGYENIFNLTAAGANLTLKDMTLAGQDFYSEYGVFYFGASTNSTLIVDNSDFDLKNDTSARGGVFKAGNTAATVIIRNGSDLKIEDVQRGFTYVTTRITDSVVSISGTDATFEHGINACKEVSISNSVVSISGGKGRGITLGKGAITYLQITDSSKVSITDMAEATISVQSENNYLLVEHNSFLVMDEEVSFTKAEYNTADFLRAVDGSHVLIGALTQGFVTYGSTGTHVYNELKVVDIKGHSDVSADVYFELYSNGVHIATTKYIKKAYTVGNLMSVFFEITTDSDSWVTEWHTYVPEWNGQSGATWDVVPDKAIAYFNGVACAVYEGVDNGKYPVNKKFGTWENVPGVIADADAMMLENGVPVYYDTVAEALIAVNADKIVNAEIYVLRDATLPYHARTAYGDDVTETITFIGDNFSNGDEVTLTLEQLDYWWAGIDMANDNGVIDYKNINVVHTGDTNYVAEITTKQGETGYAVKLADAFNYAQYGDTIKLLKNVVINEGIYVTDPDVLENLTFDGNNCMITADITNADPAKTSVLYFGDADAKAWATGVTVKDLAIVNMTIDPLTYGKADLRFAIALMGSGNAVANLENVQILDDTYLYAVNLYGMMGANITNSTISTVFTNGSDNNALVLDGTKIYELWANESGSAADMFKVQVNDTSSVKTSINTIYVWGGNTKTIAPATLAYAENILDAETLSKMYVSDARGVLYSTLQGAVDHQVEIDVDVLTDLANRRLTLLDDIAINDTVVINLGLVLDLNDKAINYAGIDAALDIDTVSTVAIGNGTINAVNGTAIYVADIEYLGVVDTTINADDGVYVDHATGIYLNTTTINATNDAVVVLSADEVVCIEASAIKADGTVAVYVASTPAVEIYDSNLTSDVGLDLLGVEELTINGVVDIDADVFGIRMSYVGTATIAIDKIYGENNAILADNVSELTVTDTALSSVGTAIDAYASNITVDNCWIIGTYSFEVEQSVVNVVDTWTGGSVAYVLYDGANVTVDADSRVNADTVVDMNNSYAVMNFNGYILQAGAVLVEFEQGASWFTTTNKDIKKLLEAESYEVAKLDPHTFYVVANLIGKVAYYYDVDGYKTYVEELNADVYDEADGTPIVVIHTDALADFVSTIRNYSKTVYIDLNAYTLDISANLMLNGNGDVTIANGYITGTKNILVYASKFTIGENAFVDVTVGNGWANSVITIAEGATVNSTIMTQGTVDVYGNLNNFTPNTDTSVLNTYEGSFVYGTINVSQGVTNLMGGEIVNVVVTGGTLNVKGGLVNNISVESDACVYVNGGWINKLMVKAYFATVEINGGIIDYLRVLSKFADVEITGGYFLDNVTEYCADDIYAAYNEEIGYYEIVELAPVRHYGNSMTLGSNLALNFYFTQDSFVDDNNYFAVAIIKHEDTCNAENVYVLIPMTEWVVRGDLYGVVVDNIAAKDMICEVEIKLFRGELPEYVDTLEEYNEIEAYAVATYADTAPDGIDVVDSLELLAMDQIDYAVDNGDVEAATMYSDLLHYGAAAQKYFGHNVNHFADHLLAEYPQFDKASAAIDYTKLTSDYKYTDNVRISLSLESTIALNVYVIIDDAFDADTLVANIEYVNYLGETVSYLIAADAMEEDEYTENGVTYRAIKVTIDTLSPADGLATIKCDITGENDFVAYYYDSIAAYAAYVEADNAVLAELYEKIAKFAISANNYFED